MAMFKMNPTYAGDPQLCVVAGSFVFTNTSPAPTDTIVQPTFFTSAKNAQGAGCGQDETVAPLGSKVVGVINPTPVYSPQVCTGGGASVLLLDLRAYPGDIVSVVASNSSAPSSTPGTLTNIVYNTVVRGIDQTNKFVYISNLSANGATIVSLQGGMSIHYVVYFKDSYTP